LFHAELEKIPIETSKQVVNSLKYYSRDISALVIWTDCDREGEAIGFDVIDICKQSCQRSNNLKVLRAHFSALTFQNLSEAMNTLTPPN
jgi:DNA topoisomerase-3